MQGQKGITLVALIITVIILLILATVSINLVINGGIIDKTKSAVDKYSEEEELEQIKLAVISAQMIGNGFLTKGNLDTELQAHFNDNKTVEDSSNGWNYKSYKIDKEGNVEKILPKEYQQLEYIESTGIQYIDTNVIPNENTSVKLDIMPTSGSNGAFFGCIESDQLRTWRFFNYGNIIYFDLNGRISGSSMPKNERTNIELNNYYVVKNGTEAIRSTKKENLNLSSSLYIFAANQSNSRYEGICSGKARIYTCKIFNGDVVVRNYIACKHKTDNKLGLYDLVEGRFYTNQGTGEFIADPEV